MKQLQVAVCILYECTFTSLHYIYAAGLIEFAFKQELVPSGSTPIAESQTQTLVKGNGYVMTTYT